MWWAAFTAIGIIIQVNLGLGIDILVAGLIISLQEQRRAQTCWLIICWVILQEGVSDLAFGTTVLWYVGTVVLFYMCNRLFEARSYLFIILLCIVLGAWHGLLMTMMASMQDYAIMINRVAWENLVQAVIILPVWLIAYKLRGRFAAGETNGRTVV